MAKKEHKGDIDGFKLLLLVNAFFTSRSWLHVDEYKEMVQKALIKKEEK